MKKKKGLVLGLLLPLLLSGTVLAAAYSASVTVTESDSIGYPQLPISFSVNNTYLVENNFMASTGNDTRVLSSTTELPHMLTENTTLFSAPITADTQHLFAYTLGNPPLSAFYIITGPGGSIGVGDDATLELSDNFTVELRGWINTDNGTGKNLVYKDAAFRLYVSETVSENVTAGILSESGWTTPSGYEDVAYWNDEDKSIDESTGTYAESDQVISSGVWSDYLVHTLSEARYVFQIRVWPSAGAGEDDVSQVDIDAWDGNSWVGVYQGACSENTWCTKDANVSGVTEIRARMYCAGTGIWVAQYHEIDYTYADEVAAVTATGLSGAEYEVEVTYGEDSVIAYTTITHAGEIEDDTWRGNTFTTDETFGLTGVYLYGHRVGSPGTLTVGIWETAAGKPTGSVLATGTYNANTLATTPGEVFLIDITDIDLDPSTMYAWSANITGSAPNYVYIRYDASGTYSEGTRLLTTNGGSVWSTSSGDYYFDLYGYEMKMYVDGGLEDELAVVLGISVPDNSADWTLLANDVVAYAEYITITVGGVQVLWLQPNDIISGTNLPDRATSVSNNGTITWGSNPSGIAIQLGALLPETQSAATAGAEAGVPEFAPETGADEFVTTGVEGEGFPFYALFRDLFQQWYDLGGPDISMPYFWKIVAVMLGWTFGTAVMLTTRNVFFGLIAYFIGFAVPAGAMGGVLDMWVPVVYGLGALSISLLTAKWGQSSL